MYCLVHGGRKQEYDCGAIYVTSRIRYVQYEVDTCTEYVQCFVH